MSKKIQRVRDQTRRAAAGVGPVPLPADAAGCGRNGAGARRNPAARADRAALRQRHRRDGD